MRLEDVSKVGWVTGSDHLVFLCCNKAVLTHCQESGLQNPYESFAGTQMFSKLRHTTFLCSYHSQRCVFSAMELHSIIGIIWNRSCPRSIPACTMSQDAFRWNWDTVSFQTDIADQVRWISKGQPLWSFRQAILEMGIPPKKHFIKGISSPINPS
jgi:hypothetical protein